MRGMTSKTATVDIRDELAFAAHAQWAVNGHDLFEALLTVHREHTDPSMRALAGEAYDLALTVPLVRAAFESVFAQRDAETA